MTERPPRPPLTTAQRRCFEFLRGFIESEGYAPTLREICAGMGWAGTNSAIEMLARLERKGYIARPASSRARAIRVLGAESQALDRLRQERDDARAESREWEQRARGLGWGS